MQGSPTVANGMVFASANLRTYYGINATNGNTIWNFTNPQANEFIVSSPIYLDGKVFIVDKFDLACLNASTGKKIWNTFTGDEYYVSPSYADGKIYIVTSERNIFIFNAITGEKLDRFILPSASWSSPTPYGGRLYIGDNDWNLYCLGEYNTANSQIALQTDKSTLKLGESLTVSGQLSPAISNAVITLTFSRPDGSQDSITVTAKTDGALSYTYTPNMEGDWVVTASYQSDTVVTSPALAFKVTSATSTFTLPDYFYALILVIVAVVVLIVAFAFLKLRTKR
jgi:outer membrane protein assembly factor BamB